MLVGASFVDGGIQAALWVAVVVVDWGGALFGISGWRLVPAHFAERHNLVIILALGESIVALGMGAEGRPHEIRHRRRRARRRAGVGTVVDLLRRRRPRHRAAAGAGSRGAGRNTLARDSYSYLHFPMAAGIVLCALALHETLAHADEPLDIVHAFALLGGTATYLLAHVALRLRDAHTINKQRLALAAILLILIPERRTSTH